MKNTFSFKNTHITQSPLFLTDMGVACQHIYDMLTPINQSDNSQIRCLFHAVLGISNHFLTFLTALSFIFFSMSVTVNSDVLPGFWRSPVVVLFTVIVGMKFVTVEMSGNLVFRFSGSQHCGHVHCAYQYREHYHCMDPECNYQVSVSTFSIFWASSKYTFEVSSCMLQTLEIPQCLAVRILTRWAKCVALCL